MRANELNVDNKLQCMIDNRLPTMDFRDSSGHQNAIDITVPERLPYGRSDRTPHTAAAAAYAVCAEGVLSISFTTSVDCRLLCLRQSRR